MQKQVLLKFSQGPLKYENVIEIEPCVNSPTFYEQLFRTNDFRAAFLTYIVGLNFFGARKLAQNLHVKCY